MSTEKKLSGPSFLQVLQTRETFGRDRPLALLPLGLHNKVPRVKWKSVTERGTPWSAEELQERWQPGDNLGIITGEVSLNLWVVDCDGLHTVKWAMEHLPPSGIMMMTGSLKGLHIYYRAPPGEMTGNRADVLNSKRRWEYEAVQAGFDITPHIKEGMSEDDITSEHLRVAEHRRQARGMIPMGPTIDIRGRGGQVVGPGSVHKSGRIYEPTKPWTPELFDAQDLISPKILDDLPRWESPVHRRHVQVMAPRDIPVQTDDQKLRRAQAYLDKLPAAVSGDRGHDRTFHPANMMVRGFDLGVEQSISLLLGPWNDRCDPPWTEKDIRHKCEDADKADDGKPRGWMLRDSPEYEAKKALRKKAREEKRKQDEKLSPESEAALQEVKQALILADELEESQVALPPPPVQADDQEGMSDAQKMLANAQASIGVHWKKTRDAGWTNMLFEYVRDKDGEVKRAAMKPNLSNIATVLIFGKAFKDNKLSYDRLKVQKLYRGEPYTDMNTSEICIELENVFQRSVKPSTVRDAVNVACSYNTFDSIGDFYRSIDEWDGKNHISDVIMETFGVDKNDAKVPLYARMLQNTLVGMMARMDKPGSKMDTVLILQGEQGYRKSTFFNELLPDGLSTDAESFDYKKKDGLEILARHVAIEMGECVHIRKESEYESLKQFLSQSVDVFRASYGREPHRIPRHCIFFGSANDDQLFSDPTGTRRFYVIPVKRKLEEGETEELRDQLLAQAKAIYERFKRSERGTDERAETRWWFEADDDWESQRHVAARSYEERHPWEEPVLEYCAEHAGEDVSITTITGKVLDKPLGQVHAGDQRVVARILKRSGCKAVNKRINGVRKRVWEIPRELSRREEEFDPVYIRNDVDRHGKTYKDE